MKIFNKKYIRKIISITILSFSFFSINNSFDSNNVFASNIKHEQREALSQMLDDSKDFDKMGSREKRDFNRVKNEYEDSTEKNKIESEKNKKEMDVKFQRMKDEFERAGQDRTLVEAPTLNAKFPNNFNANTNSSNLNMNSEYDEMKKSIENNASQINQSFTLNDNNDRRRGESQNQNQVQGHQRTRGSLNLDNEDKERINNYYNGTSDYSGGTAEAVDMDKVNSLNLTDENNPTNAKENEGFFSKWIPSSKEEFLEKKNYTKFILLCIVLFIIMAVLYFNGKRKG